MKVLFIHPNFPGQFRHVATHLAKLPGSTIVGLGEHQGVTMQIGSTPGVMLRTYKRHRESSKTTHHYLKVIENDVLRGQSVVRSCMNLKKEGFYPDLICAHVGWGDGLYLREVFPKAKIVGYFEFFYHARGVDIGFDPEFPAAFDNFLEVHTKNATQLLSWIACDYGWSPTKWQASLFPKEYQSRIKVIHEGINTSLIKPNHEVKYTLPDGKVLTTQNEILTLINRNMEPYRGFHVFMRTLPEIQKRCPHAITIIVGSECDVSYGNKPKNGKTWKQILLEEVSSQLDMSRVYFVGQLPHAQYIKILQLSRAHVYMTYPYILSWSMLEAMAAGCVVIGSNTPPVAEIITDGQNGLLFDFFDQQSLSDKVIQVLTNSVEFEHISKAARKTIVDRYDLYDKCIPQQINFFNTLLGGDPAAQNRTL